MSKRFNACGVRIGCLATKNREVVDLALRLCQARLSVATAEQLACVPMLRDGRTYAEEMCRDYQRRRDAVYDGLARIPGVRPHRSEGSLYTMTRLPIDSAERFTVVALERVLPRRRDHLPRARPRLLRHPRAPASTR